MSVHRQVTIEHEGQAAEVDEGIAPLILALWRGGLRTLASCQNISESWSSDYPPLAYVSFETEGERDAFRRIAGPIVHEPTLTVDPDDKVRAMMADPKYAADARAKGGVWGYGFPSAELPEVLAALARS
jgi:hypothetical protein